MRGLLALALLLGVAIALFYREPQPQALIDNVQVSKVDLPLCTMPRSGPIQRGYNPQPYGRKKDIA